VAGKIYHISHEHLDDGPGCPIRRLRRAPHISNEQQRVTYHYLQVDMDVGIGASDGSDPQLIMRYSNDGGNTWSSDRMGSVGTLGEFKKRVRFRRLGQGRDRVFEIVTTDPVPYRIIDAYIGVTGGTD